MVVLLHGAAGGWDEAAIAVVALGVLWLAIKLAGRKPVDEDDEEESSETSAEGAELASEELAVPDHEEQSSPAHRSPTKLG